MSVVLPEKGQPTSSPRRTVTEQQPNLLMSNKTLARLVAGPASVGIKDLLRFPKYVQIETVSDCNARCIMCPVEEWKRDVTVMKDSTFSKIVDELKNHADWIERVTIQLDGEPLMDRKLESRIQMLKSVGIRLVAFATNGSLMTPRRAASIITSGVDEVSFSVDGATKETFEKIRLRLNFDKVVKNILEFVKVRDRLAANTQIRIRMTVQEENKKEYHDFLSFWCDKLGPNDSVYGKVLHSWGNSDKNFPLAEGYDFETLNSIPCSSPWTSLVILTDGRVPLCCCDYNATVNSGDVREKSIAEVWQSRVLQKVRQLHVTKGRRSMRMCTDCTVWDDGAQLSADGVEDQSAPEDNSIARHEHGDR